MNNDLKTFKDRHGGELILSNGMLRFMDLREVREEKLASITAIDLSKRHAWERGFTNTERQVFKENLKAVASKYSEAGIKHLSLVATYRWANDEGRMNFHNDSRSDNENDLVSLQQIRSFEAKEGENNVLIETTYETQVKLKQAIHDLVNTGVFEQHYISSALVNRFGTSDYEDEYDDEGGSYRTHFTELKVKMNLQDCTFEFASALKLDASGEFLSKSPLKSYGLGL
jgi:hypothetical protein